MGRKGYIKTIKELTLAPNENKRIPAFFFFYFNTKRTIITFNVN